MAVIFKVKFEVHNFNYFFFVIDNTPHFVISECIGPFFLEAKSSVTSFFQIS